MTPEQQRAVEEFKALRGVEPFGPFLDLLASPELMSRVSALGEYLRYRSALPARLSEFIILVTAAHWRQQFEWDVHAPIAQTVGILPPVLDALWAGALPPDLDSEQQVLYELCTGLHRDRTVTADVHYRAEARLGTQAVIDAMALCGYYALLAMILNSRPPDP